MAGEFGVQGASEAWVLLALSLRLRDGAIRSLRGADDRAFARVRVLAKSRSREARCAPAENRRRAIPLVQQKCQGLGKVGRLRRDDRIECSENGR